MVTMITKLFHVVLQSLTLTNQTVRICVSGFELIDRPGEKMSSDGGPSASHSPGRALT